MFRWRAEGEQIGQGLNVYPLACPWNAGGYLVIGPLRIYARWAKKKARLHYAVSWVPKSKRSLPRSQWAA